MPTQLPRQKHPNIHSQTLQQKPWNSGKFQALLLTIKSSKLSFKINCEINVFQDKQEKKKLRNLSPNQHCRKYSKKHYVWKKDCCNH